MLPESFGSDLLSTEPTERERKIVTPLNRMLMHGDLESALSFLAKIGVRYTICGNLKVTDKDIIGHHTCRIFVQKKEHGNIQTIVEYIGGGASAKAAVCDALSKFLVIEEHDYHDYRGLSLANDRR